MAGMGILALINASTFLMGKRLKHEILLVVTAYSYKSKSTFHNYSCFRHLSKGPSIYYVITCREGGGTVRQALGEVQSLKLHQYKTAMVLSTILIKNKVFLHYKMVFNEILNHNVYLFVLTLT